MNNNQKTHGVWWAIAGASWVSALPLHHGQLTLFECRKHSPLWFGPPLRFTPEEVHQLAKEWSTLGLGRYEARLIVDTVTDKAPTNRSRADGPHTQTS